MALDGITIKTIVDELNSTILDGKIDKIAQAESDEILITIRSNKQNYKLLISANSANPRIYLCNKYKKENPVKAHTFLMILRKYISNGRIINISQHKLDRIILFEIESYNELRVITKKILSVELMGKHSNIILIDKDSEKIIDSIKRIPLSLSSVREVLPQRKFTLPPSKNKLNPFNYYDCITFKNLLIRENLELYKSLYTIFDGIGPSLSKEICCLSSINFNEKTFDLSLIQFERLQNTFHRMFLNLINKKILPTLVFNKKEEVVDFSFIPFTFYKELYTEHFESMSSLCEEFYEKKDIKERINQKIYSFKKSTQTKLEKLKLKYEKQINEINIAKSNENLSKIGELLKANIYSLEKGMKSITVIDYTNENYPSITIKLDEHLTPSQNIQSYYKKYNKSKSTTNELSLQIEHTEMEIHYLENLLFFINNINSLDEIDEIKNEIYEKKDKQKNKSNRHNKYKELDPHIYISDDGIKIYVGKNNIQNEMLTFKFANSDDIWLHAKDIPGSHVIIKKESQIITEQTIYQAALIAGLHSKNKLNSKMQVDYTNRKNVKKINNSKPGMVAYENYNTIIVDYDEKNLPKKYKN